MDAIEHLLSRGVDTIYPTKEELEKILRSGKKLTLYQGFDPTGTQLHIGHAVAMRKLREFQDLGHHVIFLIGDFTATIGDPSGKNSARKLLTHEEVLKNAESYKEQAGKILRFDGDNPVEVKFNSEWLGKINAVEFLQLAHNLTLQQVVERDMFQNRMKAGQDLFMNEFLYPVLQGYDSVAMDVDLEIGGTDQMFNMMMGRKLMRNIKKKDKFVMTVPLLTDSNGNKIGKTEGNAIGLSDPPNEFFAKVMTLGDDAIVPCLTLLTDYELSEINSIKKEITSGENPMIYKKKLALELTKWLNSESEAVEAQRQFEIRFQEKNLKAADLPTVSIVDHLKTLGVMAANATTIDHITSLGLANSRSDARRLINQGTVNINDVVITEPTKPLEIKVNDIIKVGDKKVVKIKE